MWYPAEKDTVHVVSRLSGGLTDFGEVFWHCPQQHDEEQGRKAQRRKGGRERGRAIDSGSRGGQPLYLQGHTPTKAWQHGKVKEEAVYTFRVLDVIFSLIFRSNLNGFLRLQFWVLVHSRGKEKVTKSSLQLHLSEKNIKIKYSKYLALNFWLPWAFIPSDPGSSR